MVKLRGPMCSAEARGVLGGATVISSWKGRSYAKTNTPPSNPKTAMQITVRNMLSFLAQQWTKLDVPAKTSWDTIAADLNLPPYNAFIAANLERWAQFKAPGQATPITQGGSLPSATLNSATASGNAIRLDLSITHERDGWGVLIFRAQSTPVTPDRNNCVAILQANKGGHFAYNDEGLASGTYYYQARYFTVEGKLGPNETERSATIP